MIGHSGLGAVRVNATYRIWAFIATTLLCAPSTVLSDDKLTHRTVIGANPWLSDGSHALQMRDYHEGIRLTLIGLEGPVSKRDKVAAFSNLCAGFIGISDYYEALIYCNQALEIEPENWHALNNRALAHLGLEDKDSARADVDHGLSVKPRSRKLGTVQQMIRDARNPRVVIDDRADID
jgi:tetratricopeptide (TPR) repeat protein